MGSPLQVNQEAGSGRTGAEDDDQTARPGDAGHFQERLLGILKMFDDVPRHGDIELLLRKAQRLYIALAEAHIVSMFCKSGSGDGKHFPG